MPNAKRRKPEMILAVSPVPSASTAETVQRAKEDEPAQVMKTEVEPIQLDSRDIAERVYRLMCAELRVERERRGWM